MIGYGYTFKTRMKMHNFHPRKPHCCIEYIIQYRPHLSEFYLQEQRKLSNELMHHGISDWASH